MFATRGEKFSFSWAIVEDDLDLMSSETRLVFVCKLECKLKRDCNTCVHMMRASETS